MEALIREKEFGTIGESPLKRALTMYLLALSARHVALPWQLRGTDYNISTQIGHNLILFILLMLSTRSPSGFRFRANLMRGQNAHRS